MRHIPKCALCGASERVTVYETTLIADGYADRLPDPYSAHYRINRCCSAGLCFSSPIGNDRAIQSLYELADETNVDVGEQDNVRRTMRLYYQVVKPFLRARVRMMDVGCDVGFFLEAAREDGFKELFGIEPNPRARAVAANIPGATIVGGFYEKLNVPDSHFDLISLIHVLDHTVDPGLVVSQAWQHLKPGGVLLAVVHNVRSPLGIVMGRRFPVFNLYHHYFFSKGTLRRLFELRRFDVIKVPATWNC